MRSILLAAATAAALATGTAAAPTADADPYGEAVAILGSALNGTAKADKFDFVAAKAAALKKEAGLVMDAAKNKTAGLSMKKMMILDELEGIVKAGNKPTPCQIKNMTETKLNLLFGRRLAQTGGEAIVACPFGE